MLLRLAAALFAVFALAPAQAQFDSNDPMVDASLVADLQSVAPGDRVYLALHQDITEGWHTYWRNPGDSGEATEIHFTLPEGWQAGEIIWPAPKAYPIGPLTNYGYSDTVTLPVPVDVPANAPAGPVTIPVRATWLVCEDICIPEDADLEITLNVGPSAVDTVGAALIQTAFDRAPEAAPADFQAGLAAGENGLVLTLAGEVLAGSNDQVRNIVFFPHESGIIDHAGAQVINYGDGEIRLDVPAGYLTRGGVTEDAGGVIVFESNASGLWLQSALEFTATAGASVNTLPQASTLELPQADVPLPAAPAPSVGFVQAALFALLGGLILNLMPCVFPVLSMKAITLVEKRGAEAGEARAQGLIFAAGVIGTFLALGGLLLILRVAGLPDLWGVQLQIPVVVISLALLMFLIGLNFLGVFEIGTSLQNVGSGVKDSGRRGAFFTGVLAVFVAAPCLAPFMATALAFALSQPALASLAIFAFLGVGLALPFVLVSFMPGLLAFLPKPGLWMVRFRQVLAFPMFAAAIWLVWVLVSQVGPSGVIWSLATFLAAGFAVWAFSMQGAAARVTAAIGVVLTAGAIITAARLEPMAIGTSNGGVWAEWSHEAIAEAQADGRAIFVDFTATWCVTCQVNKQVTLADADVKAVFDAENVALFRADFTNRNEVIAQELARHGSAGVPLYLVYPSDGGAPEVLPTLLSESIVIQAVERAVER